MMMLNYMIGHPIAMLPEKVTEILGFLQDREQGLKLALESVKTEDDKTEDEQVDVNGIIKINVFGSISKRMNLFQKSSGGVSSEQMLQQLENINKDEQVKGVLLNVDSPGGSVHGIKSISDVVRNFSKPIIVFSDGLMASAAYWIASGADKIIVTETSTVGSIGVVTVHRDISARDNKDGIKNTVLFAGKFKALGNPTEPLNDDARLEIQEKLDQYYSIFVENVALNRGISIEDTLNVAEGKTFIGKNAPKELVDFAGSMEFAYNELLILIEENNQEEINNMTLEEFRASEHYSVLKAENDSKVDEAVKAETERCLSILKIEGEHSDIKISAIENSKQANDVYADLYRAEIKSKKEETKRLKGLTEPIEVSNVKSLKDEVSPDTFLSIAKKHEEQGKTRGESMFAARKENPSAHSAYIKSVN